jgi:tetratricopeptide (TPR) repeat protein
MIKGEVMKTVNKYKTLALASQDFTKAEYENALRNYALVLKDYPDSKEAYNGAILAEMAMSGEEGAEALFDYYEVLREEDAEQADIVIGEILETMDGTLDALGDLMKQPLKEQLVFEDGITYGDFRKLVEQEGDFRRIFENIMFSTRVIITEKSDFVDFLERLIDNGFREMALSYLESAMGIYPNDTQLRKLLRRLGEGNTVEP